MRLGDSIRRRLKVNREPRRGGGSAAPLRWDRWILSGLAAVVLSFGTGYVLAVAVLFPAPEAPDEDATPVPRLVGKELTAAQAAVEAAGLAVGGVLWLPHPDEPAGTVLAQDPLEGQRLRAGGEVRLAVSSGRAQATVPDVVGLPFETAAQLARRLGFDVNRVAEDRPGPEGIVLEVTPAPGTERVLPAAITLTVSAAPPPPPPDSGSPPAGVDTSAPPPAGSGGTGGTTPRE